MARSSVDQLAVATADLMVVQSATQKADQWELLRVFRLAEPKAGRMVVLRAESLVDQKADWTVDLTGPWWAALLDHTLAGPSVAG